MRTSAVVVAMAVAAAGATAALVPAGAQQASSDKSPTFSTGKELPDHIIGTKYGLHSHGNTAFAIDIAENRKSATITLEEFTSELDASTELFGTRTFSLALPLAGAKTGAKVGLYIQGYVVRWAGGEASLITTVNGRAHVLDFASTSPTPADPDVASDMCAKLRPPPKPPEKGKPAPKTAAAAKARPAADKPGAYEPPYVQDGAYLQCVVVELPPASDLRLNVVLAVSRPKTGIYSMADVANIDVDLDPYADVAGPSGKQ